MWDVTTPVEMANTSEVSPNGDHLGTTLKPSDSMKEMEALNSDTNAAHNGAEDGSPTVEGKSGIVSILTSISGTPRKGSFSKEPSALFGFRERKHSLLNPNLLEQNPNDEVHYLPDTPESTVQLEGPVPQTVEEVLQYQLSHFPNCPTIGASDTAAGSPVEEVPDGEKVYLDYFARSTQVTLPSGTAYTNLYTTVSPVLLVNDDRSNVRQIARSRSRESQGLQTGRSGQRHGITWRKGSALQSIKESHEGKTGTMQLAGAEEQLALSPMHSRVLQQESTIENAEGRTIQENHMEALRILKDNAFKALNRRKVVYSK
ncbi:hypothetical protein, conserved [Angomonas deanei]|uniref:Uncharacterized protein n=1 Tax=Angomonas deanei TaxID=59799 RepID=A0A7G2C9V4_9TRYP|nr:hypothetical protein, conserved [Angomonas deanei]